MLSLARVCVIDISQQCLYCRKFSASAPQKVIYSPDQLKSKKVAASKIRAYYRMTEHEERIQRIL